MKISATLIVCVLLLTGCVTSRTEDTASHYQQTVVKMTKETYPPKNPQQIAFYSQEKKPHLAYRVIGIAKVRNKSNAESKTETMQTMMKTMAASLGGDGLMDVNATKEGAEGSIIAFQKILI